MLVPERENDRSLLRVPAGEGERPRMDEQRRGGRAPPPIIPASAPVAASVQRRRRAAPSARMMPAGQRRDLAAMVFPPRKRFFDDRRICVFNSSFSAPVLCLERASRYSQSAARQNREWSRSRAGRRAASARQCRSPAKLAEVELVRPGDVMMVGKIVSCTVDEQHVQGDPPSSLRDQRRRGCWSPTTKRPSCWRIARRLRFCRTARGVVCAREPARGSRAP
jgi:hypothetical protein